MLYSVQFVKLKEVGMLSCSAKSKEGDWKVAHCCSCEADFPVKEKPAQCECGGTEITTVSLEKYHEEVMEN